MDVLSDLRNAKAIMNNLKMDDLEEKYQIIAEFIGFDNYIKLCDYIGGGSIYIPTLKQVSKNYIEKCILQSKNNFSVAELASVYGVSQSFVYSIFRNKAENK